MSETEREILQQLQRYGPIPRQVVHVLNALTYWVDDHAHGRDTEASKSRVVAAVARMEPEARGRTIVPVMVEGKIERDDEGLPKAMHL